MGSLIKPAELPSGLFPHYHRVPTDVRENIAYRKELLRVCDLCDDTKRDVWIACARDELFFFNAFMMTYDPRRESAAVPFVTYPYQDESTYKMKLSWGKDDLLIEKSRDMGASWLSLYFIFHRWMFFDLVSVLVGSRKQEYVDKRGDLKSLMVKLDFVIEHLPRWMIPAHTRTALHLKNDNNGSLIDGESTNADFGRGDRRTVIFLDEFASVENGFEVESATRDVTKSRWYNSTPKGIGNAFHEKREKLSKLKPENIIRMHWSEHPDKAAGLYTSKEVGKDLYSLQVVDESYKFPEDYRFILDGKMRSPWYDEQCFRATSDQEIAQEIDIDYAKSGWLFFQEIEKIMARDVHKPLAEGEFEFDASYTNIKFVPCENGRVKLWVPLDVHNTFTRKEEFTLGCDISAGSAGEYSSNSVASGIGRESGRKILEFATNEMAPEEFAKYVVAIAKWLHGPPDDHGETLDAFLIWEANGPGTQFSKAIKYLNYKRIFYRQSETSESGKKTDVPGWWTSKETKRMLLGAYGTALKAGDFHNPSEAALRELREYVHQPSGDIIHSRSAALKDVDPTASGENHGDRVIADALAWRGRSEIINVGPPPVTEREPPRNSIGWRIRQRQRQYEAVSSGWRD